MLKMLIESFNLCFIVLLSSTFGIRAANGNDQKVVSTNVYINETVINIIIHLFSIVDNNF